MKKYFAKYLPVEGEIKEGDLFSCPHKGRALKIEGKPLAHSPKMIICKYGQSGNTCSDCYKVKLFLCSRDIQIGNLVFAGNEEEYAGNVIDKEDLKIWKEFYKAYKIIGEISPDATWVKEGDEFDEDQIIRFVETEVYDASAEEQFQNCRYYLAVNENFISKFEKQSYQETVLDEIIQIKGLCGHFH